MNSIISNNEWAPAIVEKIIQESPNVKTYSFKLPSAAHHVAGQHYELQLTAENGYQAARPYSAASTAENMPLLELTIQHVPDGEVSSYIYNSLEVGDDVEIRGPFGKFFVWDASITQPILLIAGGSGVVPMRSMLASHKTSQSQSKMKLIYSARTYEDIIYKEELIDQPNTTITLTKKVPENWSGDKGRISTELFKKVLDDFVETPLCYICGMSSFVSAASNILQNLNIPIENIKTERFG
jgi:ferredoxin-NADP reductase